MEIFKRLSEEGERVFRELTAQGVGFEITPVNKLRITTATTKGQFELIRLWKAQIVEAVSPKCSKCCLPMKLIDNNRLWFCPFGCESKKPSNNDRF